MDRIRTGDDELENFWTFFFWPFSAFDEVNVVEEVEQLLFAENRRQIPTDKEIMRCVTNQFRRILYPSSSASPFPRLAARTYLRNNPNIQSLLPLLSFNPKRN